MIFDIIYIIVFSLVIAVILFFFSSLLWMIVLPSPYVPLRKKDVKRIFQIVNVEPEQMVYDLGSGDGRILIHGAKNYHARCTGCELILYPLVISYINVLLNKVRNKVDIKWQSFYRIKLNKADIVICYLFPGAMKKLKPKFEKELKKGTKVVACGFPVPGWRHEKHDKPSDKNVGIYLYRIS